MPIYGKRLWVSAPRYAVNCSILFTEIPLLERPAAAKQAGFDAVEFWWPWPVASPSDADIDRFVAAITDAGVQLVGLNFFAGDMAGGDRGLVSWPARSGELRDNIDVTVAIGERLGCTAFNALYGNRTDDRTRVERDSGVTNLKFLCDLYHLATNGDDVAAAIENYADRVGHVQIADSPGRGEPGTGRLDITGHLAALAAKGY